MSRSSRAVCGKALAVAVVVLAFAPAARAQGPEFVPLASGGFASPPVTWQASAVRPNVIFLDLYNAEGALYQTYAPSFASPPPPKRISALGYRPGGLPTTAALVGGVTGTKVKRLKIFWSAAPTQKLATVLAPPEWGFRARFFAAGATVASESAGAVQVVSKIKALDRKGRLLSTEVNVFTNPF